MPGLNIVKPLAQITFVQQKGASQGTQNDRHFKLMDNLLDAVTFAHNLWKLQAFFSDVTITAVSALGGKLNGPSLTPLISTAPMVAGFIGDDARVRAAVAQGVGDAFSSWQNGVTVPGLPWYPTFAAFPGPMAPPTPNMPTPLMACVSATISEIVTASSLKNRMRTSLRGEFIFSDALFGALANALAIAFMTWISSQMVMNVLGKGPVPTFAPPYVPVGPVMGGSIIPTPGHLIT